MGVGYGGDADVESCFVDFTGSVRNGDFFIFWCIFFFCWHIFVHVFAMKMIGNIRNFFWKISALIGFLILISLLIFFFFFILDFEMIF